MSMTNSKIRIKDIAERAGVSVGTVDRVLHNRPNVSPSAKTKVEKALEEMHYQPNMYASALAYNKTYTFHVIIPQHEQIAYWEEIEEGRKKPVVIFISQQRSIITSGLMPSHSKKRQMPAYKLSQTVSSSCLLI